MLCLLSLALLPGIAGAQVVEETLRPGQRVRVALTPNGSVTGWVAAAAADSLRISSEPFFESTWPPRAGSQRETAIAWTDMRELQLSTGRSNSAGALRGALVGVGVVALFAQLAALENGGGEGDFSRHVILAAGLPVGIAGGALIGAIHGVERWQRQDIPRGASAEP